MFALDVRHTRKSSGIQFKLQRTGELTSAESLSQLCVEPAVGAVIQKKNSKVAQLHGSGCTGQPGRQSMQEIGVALPVFCSPGSVERTPKTMSASSWLHIQ